MSAGAPAKNKAQTNRGTLFLEDAEVISVTPFPGQQFITRLAAPRCAACATAGSFVHLQCDEHIPMRRPLSIMRASASDGWIEIYYKMVGSGLRALSKKEPGDLTSIIGPIGHGFTPSPQRPNTVLIGGGVGMPPVLFLAETLKDDKNFRPLVLLGSELPFPFELRKSQLPAPWLPDETCSTMPLLEEWRVTGRLASMEDFRGVYRGYVTELARAWLQTLGKEELAKTELFACGPEAMLEATAALAKAFGLPCQVCLEEFMACAVGGCAGCAVLVQTEAGPAMQKVCVDGPVFDAATVYPKSKA